MATDLAALCTSPDRCWAASAAQTYLLGKMTYSIRPTIEPISVTERMPEASDCIGRPTEHSDAGFCWVWTHSYQRWTLRAVFFPRPYPSPPHVTIPEGCSHWLPHWAIPLIIDDSVFIAPA
jgi:hypothetical protein